jgi:CoA:oxalate CoA-transferase
MVIHPDKFWPVLCEALELTELIDDPRFDTYDKRDENHRELIDILDAAFAELTWDDWETKMGEREMIACRVNELTDLAGDEQVLANRYLQKLGHRELGEFWYVPTPVDFEKTPVSIRSEAPHLGEQTDEVLGELGFSEASIKDLRGREVV